MGRQFKPTDSKKVFVGRRNELMKIQSVLEKRKKQWLVQIIGDAGLGKTRLIETLRDTINKTQKKKWICNDIIDFYKASNQTSFGLLAEIARQVGKQHFAEFEEQRQSFWKILNEGVDVGQRLEAAHRVTNTFFKNWQELLKTESCVLLLFDTCEEMRGIGYWIMRSLLPRMLNTQKDVQVEKSGPISNTDETIHQVVVVFAGREKLPFTKEQEEQVLSLSLQPLSLEEMNEFFRKSSKELHLPAKGKQLEQLLERCGGRPLYLALSYDWLRNDVGKVEELLDNQTTLGEKLVSWVRRLRDFQSDVILFTALAWRRMEAGLLSKLLDIPESEAQNLFERLKGFSFIKYRPPQDGFEGNFQLHDEMRALILKYHWQREGAWTRNEILCEIISWYKVRIDNEKLLMGQDWPRTDEMHALVAEYVYYQCEIDLDVGSKVGEEIFKPAAHYLNVSFCDLLNEEIARFERSLSDGRRDQLRFQQALMAFRRDDYSYSSQLWQSLIRIPDCDAKLKATSYMMLVELCAYTSQYNDALDHARSAENIYRDLLGQKDLSADLRTVVMKELGQLFSNWGYVYRVRGEWDKAVDYYEKALEQKEGSPKHVARTLNNIGFVYFLKGDTERAVTYVGKALQIRQELGIAYELGLGNNTMGMIVESMGRTDNAADLFNKAYHYFEESQSDRGLALAQINLGRLMRITNQFDKALHHLHEARHILKAVKDNAYLVVALNEIGCAYRQQATTESRQKAEEFLHESLELSRKMNNHRWVADNFEDLHILYYQWGLDLKKQGKSEDEYDEYFNKAEKLGQNAVEIAEANGLNMISAKYYRTTGDIDFERRDYTKAFNSFFKACELMAKSLSEADGPATNFYNRLNENANRLQQKLHALPTPEQTKKYAQQVRDLIKIEPYTIRQPLAILETFINETLKLYRFPIDIQRQSAPQV